MISSIRRHGIAAAVVAACAAAGAVPAVAGGYVRLADGSGASCYWPGIADGAPMGWANDASGLERSAYSDAASAWSSAGTKIDLAEGAGEGIEAYSQDTGDNGDDGYTYYSCPSGGFSAPVVTNLNTYYTSGYSTGERISVAAHELGHAAAGLKAYDAGCSAVEEMYTAVRYLDCGVDTPQPDDVNGANALYGAP